MLRLVAVCLLQLVAMGTLVFDLAVLPTVLPQPENASTCVGPTKAFTHEDSLPLSCHVGVLASD